MSADTGSSIAALNLPERAALSGVALTTLSILRATGRQFAGSLMLPLWGAFAVALYVLVAGA
jgi:hypothetical protein